MPKAEFFLANSDGDEAIFQRFMSIFIKGNTIAALIVNSRSAKVWRRSIRTLVIALFVAICITREMEAFIIRHVAYHHLVFVFC